MHWERCQHEMVVRHRRADIDSIIEMRWIAESDMQSTDVNPKEANGGGDFKISQRYDANGEGDTYFMSFNGRNGYLRVWEGELVTVLPDTLSSGGPKTAYPAYVFVYLSYDRERQGWIPTSLLRRR